MFKSVLAVLACKLSIFKLSNHYNMQSRQLSRFFRLKMILRISLHLRLKSVEVLEVLQWSGHSAISPAFLESITRATNKNDWK